MSLFLATLLVMETFLEASLTNTCIVEKTCMDTPAGFWLLFVVGEDFVASMS
jgi:hypothetical protein